ncbi:MAG: DUF1570 domain-containing protein [Pontixanthobacter sp.]
MVSRIFAAVTAALILAVSSAPAHAEWHKARSKHFIVYADTSEAELRKRTERLERFDALMRLLFKVEETVPVTVYMLPSMSDVQELANNRNVAGFYSASAQLAYGFVPQSLSFYAPGFTAESISMHEYAHHMLLGGTDRYIPSWATEGLAELFMTAKLGDDGSITIGAPNPSRSQSMFRGSRWSVKDMLTSDDRKIGRDEVLQRYSRGWVMVHYLWMSGERPGQYSEFIRLLNESGDALASGKEAFGDLGKLNSELNAYLRKSNFPASTFSAEQLGTSTDIAIEPLTDGEIAIIQYRMKSLLGVTEETAPKLANEARPVGARFPNDPAVQRAMAEIEYDAKQYGAADAAADLALAADPNNVMAMVYKGRVATRKAMEDNLAEDWDAARQWFLKANRADPNHPLPFVLFYDSYLAEGGVAPESAVGGLYRAAVLMPQDLSLRARASIELIRSGDIKRARSVLAPAAFSPHAAQDNPMRKLIEEIEKGSDKDALLAFIDEEKLSKLFNDFLGAEAAKELEEKRDGEKKDEDEKAA